MMNPIREENTMEWKSKYSVNIPEIDAQHKTLVGIINELQILKSGQMTPDHFEIALNKLINYSNIHFATEEYYFKQHSHKT